MVAGLGLPFVQGAQGASSPEKLTLKLRGRVKFFMSSSGWHLINFEEQVPVSSTAIVICDLWDKH
jgi:hypothetical protein